MTTKLIGAVAIKVKPDTSAFRREADKGLDRELRGMDREVDVKANVDADTSKANRKLDDLKRKANEALKVDVDLDDKASSRFGKYADHARATMRAIHAEQDQLQRDVDNGMATNWAKRTGDLKKYTRETRLSFREIASSAKESRLDDTFFGFDGIQKTIDSITAAQQSLTTMSADGWDMADKAAERYQNTLAAIARHDESGDISPAGDRKAIGLHEAAEEIRKQTAALSAQDLKMTGLKARWDSLGNAQKAAVSKVDTAKNNADMEAEENKLRIFKEKLATLGAAEVFKYKAQMKDRADSVRELLAVNEELDRRTAARRWGAQYKDAPTITVEGMNDRADRDYADQVAHAKRRVDLEEKTAVELKRIQLNTTRELNAARKLGEDARQRLARNSADNLIRISDRLGVDDVAKHNETVKRIEAIQEAASKKTKRLAEDLGDATAEIARRLETKRLNDQLNTAAIQRRENSRLEYAHRQHLEAMEMLTGDFSGRRRDYLTQAFGGEVDFGAIAKKYREVLKGVGGAKNQFADLTVNLDPKSVEKVKRDAADLKEKIEDMEAHIAVNPTGLQLAAARFAYLTRTRTVNIVAKVSGKSLAMAEGALMAMTGVNVAQNIGRKFEKAFTELDTYALKMGKLATVLGSVGSAVGALGANIFSIGAGVGESIGLLALLPTAAMTAFTGFSVFSMAFNNFSNAFSDIPIVAEQAMKDLPPLARKAVKELSGSWKGISDPVQEAFWGEMGNAVGQLKNRILPDIKAGFVAVAPHAAKFTRGVLDSFTKLADSGDMKRMFTNISSMFDNASGAAEPFFDAFNTFGLRGAEFLPRFGTWLTKISTQFNDWVQAADEAGDITRWIEQGIQSLKDMWSIGGSVIDIFKGISRAATAAGGASLTDFAEGIRKVADAMLSDAFQVPAAELFRGAIAGAGHLMVGVKDLGRAVGDTAPFWSSFLTVTGEIAGLTFTNFSKSIRSIKLQDGILIGLTGMRDMVKDLGPTFRNVGNIVGDLGIIAGGVFSGMAPLINAITTGIAGVTGKLAEAAAGLSPALVGQLTGTVTALGTALGVVAAAVGGLIGWFNTFDDSLKSVIISIGAFVLLKGSIGKTISAITNTAPFAKLRNEWTTQAVLAGKTQDQISKVGAGTMVLGAAGARVRGFTDDLKASGGAMGGVRTAGSKLFNLMGGGWGLAIGGAVSLLSMYSQQQAKTRASVDSLSESMNAQTGAWTAESDKIIAKNLAVAESFLGIKMPDSSGLDIAEKFGIPLDKVVAAAKGVPGAMDEVSAAMEDAGEGATGFGTAMNAASLMGIPFADGLGNIADKFGIGMSAGDQLNKKIGEQRILMEAARAQTEKMAAATGVSTTEAKALSGAFQAMADDTSTVTDRVAALKVQLDILKGGTLSAKDAARNFAKEWDGSIKSLEALSKTDVGLDKLVDMKGNIADMHGAGGELYDAAKSVSDAILTQSTSAYKAVIDGKGTIAEAEKAAADALTLSKGQIEEFATAAGISVPKAEALLNSFFGQDWEMVAMMGVNAEAFFTERERATAAGEEFNEKTWKAYLLGSDDNFIAAKEAADAAGVAFSAKEYEAYLKANPNPAKQSVDAAVGWARAYSKDPYEATITAANKDARVSIADAATKGKAWSKDKYEAWLKALDKTDPGTAAAVRSIKGMTGKDYSAIIKALNGATPGKDSAQRTINSVSGKTAEIKASNKTGDGKASVNRSLSGLKFTASVTGRYLGWKTFPALKALTVSVWGAFKGTKGGPGAANGAIWDGKSDPLAGKWGMQQMNLKAFANGGIESHVAQIANPTSNSIRIWAEPETGGEAYIPLAASKRARSLEIWKETGKRLNAYADGGIEGDSASSGTQQTFNITNHYPVAEKTSVTVNKALQYASVPGL